MPGVSSYPNQDLLLNDVKSKLLEDETKAGSKPRFLIIGALGRCGKGAVDSCKQAGILDENILKWDLPEPTAKPGPYKEITTSDIFINCISLSEEIPPLLNDKSLLSPDRKLSVVCDISCDTTNPHNPIPIYKENSTFDKPTLPVKLKDRKSTKVWVQAEKLFNDKVITLPESLRSTFATMAGQNGAAK